MKPMASMLILKYVRSRLEAFEITPAGAAAPWAHSPVSERTPLCRSGADSGGYPSRKTDTCDGVTRRLVSCALSSLKGCVIR